MIKRILAAALFLPVSAVLAVGPISGGSATFTGGTVTGTITSTATAPFAATFGGATSGAFNALVFQTNETAVPRPGQSSQVLGDFALRSTFTAASNGAGRRDNQLSLGYNPAALSNDDQFFFSFENSYTTGANIRQGEFYFVGISGDGVLNTRPFSIDLYYDLHTTNVALRANAVVVGYNDTTYDWVSFNSTAASGSLALSRASTIDYTGTVQDFMTYGGSPLLGYDSTGNDTGRLFAGAQAATLFANKTAADAMQLNLGNRGLRWDVSAGWQFQTGSSTWQNMGLPLCMYTTSATVGFGPTAFSNTGTTTFEIYDATATTGRTNVKIRGGAGQAGNYLEILANNDSTTLMKVDAGSTWSDYFRSLDGTFALQTGFDATNVLLLGSAKKIGFSATTAFSGTVDTAVARGGVGVVSITSVLQLGGKTFAALPTAATGMVAYVTDGLAAQCGDTTCTTFGTTVLAGGGALKLCVFYNGTNWTLIGK